MFPLGNTHASWIAPTGISHSKVPSCATIARRRVESSAARTRRGGPVCSAPSLDCRRATPVATSVHPTLQCQLLFTRASSPLLQGNSRPNTVDLPALISIGSPNELGKRDSKANYSFQLVKVPSKCD